MKKLSIFLLALTLILVGCGDSNKDTKNESSKTEESKTEDSKEEKKEDTKEESIEDTKEESIEDTKSEETEKEQVDEETSSKIELGKPIKLGDYTVTVKDFKLVKDYNNKDALKIIYSWENGSKETKAPFLTVNFKGYQDSVETDDFFMSDKVDLGISQKDVKAGGKLDNIESAVLVDVNKPLELELSEILSFDNNSYKLIIQDLSQYK
ncbi:DUF5067 domain-containing protein [Helcococcus kunzii]|uniref:DUF5067 domain-containing protein n=1 Tax=Helcococcus kunzii TaxID=40091 RepID=UPI0024ADCC12|nr:DUF5067 domain-containing protein [Helcococcus kunzii]